LKIADFYETAKTIFSQVSLLSCEGLSLRPILQVNGQWSMVNGQWSMVNGQIKIIHHTS
jgi:hypothetical protein